MSTTIEQLQLEVESNASSAVSGVDALASSLGKLKTAVKGGVGLISVAKQLTTLNTVIGGISRGNAENLNKLAQGLKTLSSCANLKLSSSVATQITNLGTAVQSLNGVDLNALHFLANALTPLTGIGKANLNSFISQLQRLPQAVQALSSADLESVGGQITQLVQAFQPLTQIGKNKLTSFITQLSKIPKLMQDLRSVDIGTLTTQIQQLANAFAPLASQMQAISAGFASFPNRIQRLIQTTNNLSNANNRASTSYTNLAAKIAIAVTAVRSAARVLATWITASNKYVEDLNLFTVSMGEYATEAQRYAEQVADIMGIDPGEFMRNQGIFMTLATGFGVVNDRAYTMSKNLTQLGYDLSSFFNISFADSMQKLQSGIAGELEPLRRLGYDLSVARLQQEALNLGITKSVNAMTQAEKAELRYYAIMTQVTAAQGDMARTLNAPANQLRVLQAQVTQCARALGNIFIPALNTVLPYAIAVAKVIRMVADVIAGLFGFKLPEIDYSGINNTVKDVADNTDNITNALDDAAKKAKKLKTALLGIDELNIISPPDASSAGSDGVGSGADGGLGFELPTYDFLSDALNSKVQAIVNKMKEWLGLTEDIDTWSEFFHTRLGKILITVGAIGLGFAAWKISTNVINALKWINELKGYGLTNPLTIAIGISLLLTGIGLEWSGIIDTIKNELDGKNFAQIITGGLLTVAGGAFLGKGIASWITEGFSNSAVTQALTTAASNLSLGTTGAAGAAIGAGVAGIIAGIPAYFVGIYDAIKNGLNWLNGLLIPAGSTAAATGIGAIIGACGGPIGAGIGALIGLAVGLITDGIILITQNWDKITAFLKKFFTVTIPGIWKSFVKWLKNLPNTVSEWFTNLWKPIKEFDWKALGHDVGEKVGIVVEIICNAWSTLFTEILPKVWTTIKSAFKTFFTETLPTFFTKIVPSSLSNMGDWLLKLWQSIYDGLKDGWNTSVKAVTDFVSGFDWKQLGEKVGEKAGIAVKTICNAISTFFTKTLPDVWTTIKSSFKTFFTKTLPDFFTKTIPSFFNTVKSSFKTFFTKTLPSSLSNIGKWFVDIGQAIWDGIKKGWDTAVNSVGDFVSGFVDGFKKVLGIHSPSKVFEEIGGYTVLGYNNGITNLGKTTKSIVDRWVNSFTDVDPVMRFAVDTSALKYYTNKSFTKSISDDVTSNRNYSITGFEEGMEEFYRKHIEPMLSQMAEDVHRQADKNEQTIVQIGNRTVNDAVTTQRKTNGYVFAK